MHSGCAKREYLWGAGGLTDKRCPLFTLHDEHTDQCRLYECPYDHRETEDGKCAHCPIYHFGSDKDCFTGIDKSGRLYFNYMGSHKFCPTLPNGEVSTFVDDFGQIQCPNSTYIVPKSDNPRVCKPSEMLRKEVIGCKSMCPEYQSFNFLTQICEEPECDPITYIVTPDGLCTSCYFTTGSRFADHTTNTC